MKALAKLNELYIRCGYASRWSKSANKEFNTRPNKVTTYCKQCTFRNNDINVLSGFNENQNSPLRSIHSTHLEESLVIPVRVDSLQSFRQVVVGAVENNVYQRQAQVLVDPEMKVWR